MTAEIALINRLAVTLAADSAVTLTVRGAEKVFTSVDKIFELTSRDPIGIMLYNNLEYVGVPLEVAVRQFRDTRKQGFKSVGDAAEEFFKYLEKDLKPDDEGQRGHAMAIIRTVFESVMDRFERKIRSLVAQRRKTTNADFASAMTSAIKVTNKAAESFGVSACFADEPDIFEKAKEFYADTIKNVTTAIFGRLPLTEQDHADLVTLAVNVLVRDYYSDSLTGLVIAGFAGENLFPSLHAFEMDGVVFHRIKRRVTETFESNRDKVEARVIPFAQREMVDRFIEGIDPEFQDSIIKNFKTLTEMMSGKILDAANVKGKRRNAIAQAVKGATDTAVADLKEKVFANVRTQFRQQIEDMVLFMPKPELANFAAALVNITSVKRKFSAEKETVGGPVDVAVITHSEGFVWVQRKHYFKPDLNPRFFHRKYGSTGMGESQNDTTG
jgi:hypothetical protein